MTGPHTAHEGEFCRAESFGQAGTKGSLVLFVVVLIWGNPGVEGGPRFGCVGGSSLLSR